MDVDWRARVFGRAPWYDALSPNSENLGPAWNLVKGDPEGEVWVQLLIASLAFADRHLLIDAYGRRFSGVHASRFGAQRARDEHRTQTFPIWEIANELLVGCYLEAVFGWRLLEHEPVGNGRKKGDWLFETPSSQAVFVEVKSLAEPDPRPSVGAYSASIDSVRIHKVLKEAYSQLPKACGTLVVLVGNRSLWTPKSAPLVGAVPAALFGHFGITFEVGGDIARQVGSGPSMREMSVHEGKNRKLGCVAALRPGGADVPSPGFYAIHNPFAHSSARLHPADFGAAWQFMSDRDAGQFVGEDDPDGAWAKIVHRAREAGTAQECIRDSQLVR